jgi:hypothetical protein
MVGVWSFSFSYVGFGLAVRLVVDAGSLYAFLLRCVGLGFRARDVEYIGLDVNKGRRCGARDMWSLIWCCRDSKICPQRKCETPRGNDASGSGIAPFRCGC